MDSFNPNPKPHNQSELTDHDCFVCFDIMCEPSRTPCGHYMCLDCLDNVLALKRNCPFCRTAIPEDFNLTLDEPKQLDIKAKRPEQFAKRFEEIMKQRLNTDTLKIVYGNTHRILTAPQDHNQHEWKVFVKLANGKLNIDTYISKVVFLLHHTFPDPVMECYCEPFEVECSGWGVFEIPITIYWKTWLDKQPSRYIHMLSFDGEGDWDTDVVKFKKSIYRTLEEERDDDGEAHYE